MADTSSDGYPPFPEMARNLAETGGAVVEGIIREGRLLCGEDLVAHRRAICQDCAQFAAPRKRCRKCGCFMRIKWSLAKVKCPLGLW